MQLILVILKYDLLKDLLILYSGLERERVWKEYLKSKKMAFDLR